MFLTLLGLALPSKLIYRKYEKKHPKRNYVQVVEIFETHQQPPGYSKSDKELNDFLARDAYKTDMNCSKEAEETTTTTTSTTTTTAAPVTFPTIPTTAFRRVTPPTTTMKIPNFDDLFTISVRSTKPTIRPNPKENQNPDYTNVIPWKSPDIQATKHSPNANTPTIVIIAPDDQPKRNQSSVKDVDNEFSKAATTESSRPEIEDDEIIYPDSSEKDDEYENYDIIKSSEIDQKNREIEPPNEGDYDDDYDEGGDNDDYQDRKRRKRHRTRVATKKRRLTKKHTNKT